MGLGTIFQMKNPLVFSSFVSRVIPGMSGAMQSAGDEIVELAKKETQDRLYPGHGLLTGALHDSYTGTATTAGTDRVEIEFGSDLYYSTIVEFSWGGRVSHFFPAMQVVESEAPNIIRKHVDSIFKM